MPKRFSAGRAALLSAIDKGRDERGHRRTIPWISDQADVPQATLYACKYGARCLSTEQAQNVANALNLRDGDRQEFLSATREARTSVVHELTLRERLAAPDASLRVDSLPYGPFSNGKDKFVDKFLTRFFQLSGVKMARPGGALSSSISDHKAKLLARETDVAVNLICSLPRLKLLNFLLFPMRLSISAVIPNLFKKRRTEVQEKLLGKRTGEDLRLVVADWEVGYDHATAVVGFAPEPEDVIRSWDTKKMAERLQKLMETHQDPSGPVPVLVADEIMSLSVLTHLAEKSTLVFPLSTKYNIRNLENRRDAPEYRLGLAIDRGARELSDYLEEALRFYLLTDTETIASAYARLFDELTKFVLAAISPQDFGLLDRPRESSNLTRYRLARDFSRYVLRLDREEIEAYKDHYLPWSNVLRRAYQLVCEAQARDRLRIRQHVEDTLRETVGAGFGHRPNVPGAELRLVRTLLEEDFDVRLAEEDDSSQSLESIVSRVQTALLGSTSSTSQGVPIIAAGPEHLSSVLDLFSQFEKEMRNRRTSTGAIPGADELKNLLSAEGSDAFILLAVLHGQFIGCVQVAPFEGQTARLTRLFVRQRWREPRVAAALVWRAIEYAARHEGYSRVVIRETQTPGKVLEIFKRHGFQVAGDNADLLEYPLQQSPEREPPFETHPAEPG